ncbi:MAG: Cna B-type domain-containing protein [Clostridia bacterium]|nr:Cna B-type domain-containing protein [Clostridia bacterium]
MKQRLQRILSILCVLALVIGCLAVSALAENEVSRVITVKWEDTDNYEGLRPESVTVNLGAQSIVLNPANGWTGGVSVPESSTEEWTVPAIEGYTTIFNGTKSEVTSYTFSHRVLTTRLTTSVVWEDAENASGIRPEFVKLCLLADGNPFRTPMAVSAANNWTAEWENLPVNKKGTTTPIVYSLAQVESLQGYSTAVDGSRVINTLLTGKLQLEAHAVAPEGADVSGLKLTVSGPDPRMPMTLTLGDLTNSKYDFGDVIPGAYVVQESNGSTLLEGYVNDPLNSRVGDAVLVKAGEGAQLFFVYAWKEPEEQEPNEDPMAETGKLTFEIIGPDPRLPMTVTYAQFTNGTYELDNLVPGNYAVIERNAEGLVRAYELNSLSVTGMTLTVGREGAVAVLKNIYEPAPTPTPDAEVIDIPVVKIWNDNDNADGNRPASITVNLFADAVKSETVTITAEMGWQYTFVSKPRYREDGEEIAYTVTEEEVPWYTSSVNGTFITNTYNPETTSASVSKVWDDNNNAQKIRPTTLAVTLLPTGEVFVLSEENGWYVEKKDLPTRINGEDVTWSWKEQGVAGYNPGVYNQDGTVTVITNTVTQLAKPDDDQKQPKRGGDTWVVFEEYDTALGGETIINHVGDCFD